MLTRIFPKQFDNAFAGWRLAIWLFVPIVIVELGIGANSMISTRMVAMSADGIPLDRYGKEAADAVVALFALLGLSRLVIALLCALALIRYRSMLPLLYLTLLLLHLGARVLNALHPIASAGAAPGGLVVNALLALLVLGFVLSLVRKPDRIAA
jgi:hypothetical protein